MVTRSMGAFLLVLGFLAGLVGTGLMFYSVEDEERNDNGWFFQSDPERSENNQQRYEAGRLLTIGGLVVLVVGGVLLAVGGSGRTA